MMNIYITLPLPELLDQATINGEKACDEMRAWASGFSTASEAWLACDNPYWMLLALESCGLNDANKLIVFACRCVRDTPLGDGRKVWDLLIDPRSRSVVEEAERFASGESTAEQLKAAFKAACESAQAALAAWSAARNENIKVWIAARAVYEAAYSAMHALDAAYYTAMPVCNASDTAWHATKSAIFANRAVWYSFANRAVWYSGEASELKSKTEKYHANLVREIFGNPFKTQKTQP